MGVVILTVLFEIHPVGAPYAVGPVAIHSGKSSGGCSFRRQTFITVVIIRAGVAGFFPQALVKWIVAIGSNSRGVLLNFDQRLASYS